MVSEDEPHVLETTYMSFTVTFTPALKECNCCQLADTRGA
jgi:hypothetical protein